MTSDKAKIIAAGAASNALEFYDFTLYGFSAALIGKLFFPTEDAVVSVIATWGTFAAGFFMRAFGAIVFGYIGDKFGRKLALTLSIFLMGFPTFIMGCLPTYESIGIAAPILLILCRIFQGLSTGGAYNGSAIFALEHIGNDRPGFYTGLMVGGAFLGMSIAAIFGSIVMKPGMPEWAWRVPFFFGVCISFVGLYIKKKLNETPTFKEMQKKNQIIKMPLKHAFLNNKSAMTVIFMCGAVTGSTSHTLAGYLNAYLNDFLQIPLYDCLKISFSGLTATMISCQIMGYLFDKFGRTRFLTTVIPSSIIAVFFIFYGMQTLHPPFLYLGAIALGIIVGATTGTQHVLFQSLIPPRARYSGVSFAYSFGIGTLGGCTALFSTFIIHKTGNLYATPMIMATYLGLALTWYLIHYARRKSKIKRGILPHNYEQNDSLVDIRKAA